MKNQLFSVISIAIGFSSIGMAAQQFHSNSSAKEERIYDTLFPTYAEVCAGSQELPFEGAQGGPIGHEILYLRGLCRDQNSEYPRLRDCNSTDKEPGVGISVDQVFNNVPWVAIDDRDFMFRGNLAENQPLSKEVQEATMNEAVRRGYFKNIKTQDKYFKGYPANESKEKWLARESLGTSYALNFHRNLICARMPLPVSALSKIKTYLNDLNESYYSTGKTYDWNVLTNNCVHVVHNALAATGIQDTIGVSEPFPISLFNIASPPNDWALTTHRSLFEANNPWQVYSDSRMRNLIKNEGWMTSQAGGMVEVIPIHSYKNEVADITTEFHMLGIPKFGPFTLLMNHYLSDANDLDLKTNLQNAKARLDRNLTNRYSAQDFEILFERRNQTMPRDFLEFYAKYLQVLQAQSDELERQIQTFNALQD